MEKVTETISFRLTKRDVLKLKKLAASQQRTSSNFVRVMVLDVLEKYEPRQKS